MCGICGRLNFNDELVTKEFIHRMCQVLKHRGPDDEGIYINPKSEIRNPKIGMGVRRLKVIDLETGHQPIHNEDKRIWIVCNGEIYNFKDLRMDLEKRGHKFYTKSDTETIIHLYEDYGIDCVKYLRGMFAFAIWDERKRGLFLARDRLGQKPLVYAMINGSFIFASEIKSILENPEVEKEVNLEALHHYLTYQYIPASLTMFSGIKKLPPASILICNAKGEIKIERYWDLNYKNKLKLSEPEYCEKILELLREAVELRLISDVPLGAFLSGGIDSSAVVGIMSQLMDRPVKTFSIGFEEEDFSEINYARTIAKYFHTDHYEFIVKPETIEILPKLIWHYNEPFADSSALPTYYLARETRKHVTVALNGDGGDENFAGYDRYKANKIASYCNIIPRSLKRIAAGMAGKLPMRKANRFFQAINESPERRNIRWHCFFDNERKNKLYSEEMRKKLSYLDAYDYMINVFQEAEADDFLDKILYTDINTYLPGDLLVKMDIATMAHSLEARSPFLDHKFMEFNARIPSRFKLKGLTSKYILKKALKGLLPEEILKRGKMGFGIPIGKWFRYQLKDYIREILLDTRNLQRGYFTRESIRQLLDEHISGKVDHGYRLWALLNLELWHRMFIDGTLKV
jgi:asparagine synthase (glutamine-hydrolysing)